MKYESAETTRHLCATTQTQQLRWLKTPAHSLRTYDFYQPILDSFCVSTKSSELIFIIEGEITVSMGPSSQVITLRQGQYGLIPKGTPHKTSAEESTKMIIVDTLRDFDSGLYFVGKSGHFKGSTEKTLEEVWENIERLSPSQIVSVVTGLSGCIDDLAPKILEQNQSTQRMLIIKSMIERCFSESINIEALAKAANVDRFYLSRSFKQNFGTSPRNYLQHLRTENLVWTLLETGAEELTQTAANSGFGDYSTFCRKVRHRFGKPPSELVSV